VASSDSQNAHFVEALQFQYTLLADMSKFQELSKEWLMTGSLFLVFFFVSSIVFVQ